MKTRTVTVKEGELLGPVDYTYDFTGHFSGLYPGNEGLRATKLQEAIETLKRLEAHPGEYEATTDGGWPRCGWGDVIAVGMYDGWPFWRPVPSVCIKGPLGGEWSAVHCITGIKRKGTK